MSNLNEPLVSIIIPLYNRKQLVSQTVDSLLFQSYKNWEAIIVDDGSTDGSLEHLEVFVGKEERIKLLSRPDNKPKGAPACRNFGIENSKGSYIIFLDSDDLLAPYCLERRVQSFNENPDKDFLIFQILCFNIRPGDSAKLWNIEKEKSNLSRMLDLDIPFVTISMIWKKSAIDTLGKWDERLLCWQDYDLHIRALISGFSYKFINSEPDAFYRRGNDDKITRVNKEAKQLYSIVTICENVYNYFKKHNNINQENKNSIFELYMSVAIKFLNVLQFDGIKRIISDLRRLQIISALKAAYLLIIFKISILAKKYGLENILSKIFYKVWQSTILPYLSKFPPRDNTCQRASVDDAFVKQVPSILADRITFN